jgi:hypothetical protein
VEVHVANALVPKYLSGLNIQMVDSVNITLAGIMTSE